MPVWEEHAYTRRGEDGKIISLEDYNKSHSQKAFNKADFKLYCVSASISPDQNYFLTDDPISPMYRSAASASSSTRTTSSS